MYRPLLLALSALVLAACSGNPSALLSGVEAGPPPVSPDLRGQENRLRIAYTLGMPAQVSAHLVGPDGREWTVHEEAERPLRGEYQLSLDGTVPGPGPNERSVLPDGDYRVVLVAEAAGRQQQTVVPLRVRDADTIPPTVEGLTLFPALITPNADADADVTRVTYRLAKAAHATAFADRVLPDGRRERVWTGEERKLDGGEHRLVWDGTLSGRPVADGAYEFGVRAQDEAGNVREARAPLTIEAGGVPEAKVVWARVAPRQIIRGNEVCLDVVVRNTGQTVLRTLGPDPSYVYNSLDSYSSIENHAYVERAGHWRVGLDWAGSSDTTGARYPYRWGFGRDLAPGEEAEVHGCVRVNNENTRMVFFGALIQENVAIHDSGIGLAEVRVSP